MKYELVIFDFDYTLADASASIVKGFYYAMEYIGVNEVSENRICQTIGMSLKDAYTYIFGEFNQNKFDIFYKKFVAYTNETMLEQTILYDDVKGVLEELRKRNILIAVLTNKFRNSVEEVFEREDLVDLFDCIVGSNNLRYSKPNPEGINSILKTLGVDRKNALYIGDHYIDALTAEAAQIEFLGVTSGVTSYENLKQYKSIGIVNRLNEVIRFLQ